VKPAAGEKRRGPNHRAAMIRRRHRVVYVKGNSNNQSNNQSNNRTFHRHTGASRYPGVLATYSVSTPHPNPLPQGERGLTVGRRRLFYLAVTALMFVPIKPFALSMLTQVAMN